MQLKSLACGMCALTLISVQAAAADDSIEIEEVLVTAQKRQQAAIDVPISISAYDGATIRDLGIRSAEDLERLTPGLEVSSAGGTGTKVWSIRGVGFNDYSTSASSTVGLYVDDVAIPYPVMFTGAFLDVEHMEVTKGPQGDLFGRNTTAGQVSIISRKPTRTFEAGATLGYSRYDTFDFEGFVSGPLTDNIRGRLAASTTQSNDGWQQSLSRPGDTLGKIDREATRAMLDWDLGSSVNLLLSAHFNTDHSDNEAPTAFDGREVGLPYPTRHGGPFNTTGELESAVIYSDDNNTAADWTNGPGNALRPRRNNRLYGASAKLRWDLGGAELVAVSGYDEFRRREANDWDGTALLDSSNINTSAIDSFSQEVRLGSSTERLNWVAGLYYSTDWLNEHYNYFFGEGRFGINQLNTSYIQKTNAFGAFGHLEVKLTERTEAVLGLRATREDRTWNGCTNDVTPPSLPVAGMPLNFFLNNIINGAGVITPNGLLNDAFNFPNGLPAVTPLAPNGCGTFDDLVGTPNAGQYAPYGKKIVANQPMWKVGINFHPISDVLLYASVSRGFKSGGFNGANSNTQSQLQPYRLEKLTAFEIGAKAKPTKALEATGAIFYYDYRDKQESDSAVTPVGNISGLSNIPKSWVLGAELDVLWLPVKGLRLNGSLSALQTRITDWHPVDQLLSAYPTVVRFDAAGDRLPNAPKFSGNFMASYDIPAANYLLTPAFDVVYRGATSGDIVPENYRAAYTLANLSLSVSRAGNDHWRGQFWVRNLADTQYYVSGQTGGNFTVTRTNGMPRTYGVNASYSY